MRKLRNVPRILKINRIEGYLVSMLFNNGESRIVDFKEFFLRKGKIKAKNPSYKLMKDKKEFDQIEVIDNTIGWKNVGIESKDFDGNKVYYYYELDPIVLFESSSIDEKLDLNIGKMIKLARKAAGLTQDQLAQKIGTSKHYISRIENDKSDIELLTLKKIIEGGLGKNLQIKIA